MSSSPQRTLERIRHHFEVEKELAARMRASTREDRMELFKTLYTELFERVPDHPRLTRRESPEASRQKVGAQMRLLQPFLTKDSVVLEFAPGDCRLASAVAGEVRQVYGVDISDQRSPTESSPPNLDLIVYDGYELRLQPASVDVVFSYQFVEHLHPEDVVPHFTLARSMLKAGGVYVLDTPHRHSGPHDVSRYFGDTLQCFHFQEWTYNDMRRLLLKNGFSKTAMFRFGKPRYSRLANWANELVEGCVGLLPQKLRRRISSRLFQSVAMIAWA